MQKYDDIFINIGADKICASVCSEKLSYDMKKEWHSIAHSHSSYELHYIINGSATLTVYKKDESLSVVTLNKGDIMIISPNTYHNTKTTEKSANKFSFTFDISGSEELKNIFKFEKDYEIFRNLGLNTIFSSFIDSTLKENKSYRDTERKAYLMLIFSKIISVLSEKTKEKDTSKNELSDKMQRRNQIDEFFNLENVRTMTIGDLSSKLHLSEKQTTRILKQETGKNFRQLLTEKHIQYGKMLLEETEMTVEEISEKLGFSTSSSFVRAFKSDTGKTPHKYRKEKEL